ncbi:MAG: O-antigen ligase family protein, partial [Planctomycetota bacterium]
MHKHLQRLCMLMVLATLLAVPLAGGGSLFAGWAGRLAATAVLTGLGGLALLSSSRPTIRWSLAGALLLVLLVLVAFQLPRLPRGLVGQIAPGRLDLQHAADPEGATHGIPLSVDRAGTRDAWMALAAASVMFVAVSQLANTRRRALRIAACLPMVLGLSALVGVVQEQPGHEAMFNRISLSRYDVHPDAGYDPTMPHDQGAGYGRLAPRGSMPTAEHPPAVPVVRYRGATDSRDDLLYLVPETATPDIFGTFTTTDSFSAWMLLGAPLAMGFLLALAATARQHYDNLMGCLTTRHGNLLLLLALACPLLGAVAVAYLPPLAWLLLLGQAVLLCLVSCKRCSLRRALPRLAVAVLLAGGVLVALPTIEPAPGQSLLRAVVLPRLAERMELTRLGTRAAVAMWRDAPWLGHGAGTFDRLYPLYAVGQFDRLLHYPHNAPAGWLAEVGLLGIGTIAVALSMVLFRGVVGWFRAR